MASQLEEEVLRIVIVGASIQPGLLHKELLVGAVRIPELEGDRVNGAIIAISSIRERSNSCMSGTARGPSSGSGEGGRWCVVVGHGRSAAAESRLWLDMKSI